MVRREGHIDVVFRNGLKEMEVLPPCDLWDTISPAIKGRRERLTLLKVAAGVAAIISLSILAFVAGSRSSSEPASLTDLNSQELIPEISDIGFVALAGPSGKTIEISSSATNNSTSEILDRDVISESFDKLSYTTSAIVHSKSGSEVKVISLTSDKVDPPELLKVSFSGTINLENPRSIDFDESVAIADNRWRVGARVSPTYLSSNLKAANQNMSELISNENAVLSYTGGFAVSYSMGNRLSLQTGAYYSSLGREISGISSYSGFEPLAGSKSGRVFGVETTSGTINTTNRDIFLSDVAAQRIQSIYSSDNFDPTKENLTPLGTSLKQNFEYLEIPIILSYKIIDRIIDLNLLGGMSYNFLLDNKAYAIGEESLILVGSTEDINRLLLSSAFGMSLEYSLTNRFSFNIEPSLRYYLNNSGSLSFENSYTFGIYSGLFFNF